MPETKRPRTTSVEAFRAIEKDGLLPRLQFLVYSYLMAHGPLTAAELDTALRGSMPSGSITTRLSELRNSGVVEEVGTTVNPRTGKTVLVWDVTGRLPVKLEKVTKVRCAHCGGKGYFVEEQAVFPLRD